LDYLSDGWELVPIFFFFYNLYKLYNIEPTKKIKKILIYFYNKKQYYLLAPVNPHVFKKLMQQNKKICFMPGGVEVSYNFC